MEKLEGFTTVELTTIIQDFLDGISIRQISEKYVGYGRTSINNLIERFASGSKENAELVSTRKLMNRTHKTKEAVSEYSEEDISEETVQKLYRDIINKKVTLTMAASSIGKTRDYLKSRIVEYINNEAEVAEFNRILKKNQTASNRDEYEEFLKSDCEQRKSIIFRRLQERVEASKRTMYSQEVLDLKFERLKKYLLVKRNSKIENEADKFTEEQFWIMLFDSPLLLSLALGNKIRPAIENLDNNPDIGYQRTNRIISIDGSILGSSITRTNLQIKMVADFGYLPLFLAKPRNFRNSPEILYALMSLYKDKEQVSSEIFLSRSQLKTRFGLTPEQIKATYDIKTQYGDDEYFDSIR